ncbi:MAG: adenylate kinase [Candidatus Gastranaerophilales bacterium]|nr:adenylate kinase [Candidatus Gastranaerophilales bacterium]
MKKELVFVGPPASGKGTQTEKLAAETGLPHVDTGSLLRSAIKSGSEMGKIANSFIEKGNLVPTELVAKIIQERLAQKDCEKGFILDGYPRSLEQAEALDSILEKGSKLKVIYFDIPIDNLVERIVNRRSCPKCGAIFNIKTMKMKDINKCQACGADLVQRADDTEEIAKARFDTYFKQTAPLVDFYEKRGELIRLDAQGSIDEVYTKLKEAIK